MWPWGASPLEHFFLGSLPLFCQKSLGAAQPMEGHGKAMGLVAHALNKMERRRIGRKMNGLFTARQKEFFFPFGERRHGRNARRFKNLAYRHLGRVQLPLSPVDENKIRQR